MNNHCIAVVPIALGTLAGHHNRKYVLSKQIASHDIVFNIVLMKSQLQIRRVVHT